MKSLHLPWCCLFFFNQERIWFYALLLSQETCSKYRGAILPPEKLCPNWSGRLKLEITDSSLSLSSVVFFSLETGVACILVFVCFPLETELMNQFAFSDELSCDAHWPEVRTSNRRRDLRLCVTVFLLWHSQNWSIFNFYLFDRLMPHSRKAVLKVFGNTVHSLRQLRCPWVIVSKEGQRKSLI